MDAQTFLDNFATIIDAASGVQRLQELALGLALRGSLVEHDRADEPAEVLLGGMPAMRDAMVRNGTIGKPRHPEGVPVDDPPYEIPPRWAWARLGDVGAIVGGGTPKTSEPKYWADGAEIPWLTPADMRSQSSQHVSRGARDITALGLAESSAQLLPAGAVLFSSRAPIGHVGIAAQPLATNQGFKSCVPYVSAMTKYLYVFLRYVGPSVDATATGTTFKEVSGKEVALIPVPVPPLAEQQRIVARVDELTKLCGELLVRQERRHRCTTRLRGSAFHALTEAESPDDLRRAWRRISTSWPDLMDSNDGAPALRLLIYDLAVAGRLSWTASTEPNQSLDPFLATAEDRPDSRRLLGRVPPDWKCLQLGDLLTGGLANGASPRPVDHVTDVMSLKLSATTRGVFDPSHFKYVDISPEEAERYWLRPDDLLVQRSNTPAFVGMAALYDGPERTFIYPDLMMRGRVRSEVDHRYVHLFLMSSYARSFIRMRASGTSQSMVKVNQRTVLKIPIALPARLEQERIVQVVDHLMGKCARLERGLGTRASTQAALAAAIAGEGSPMVGLA